MEEDKTVHTYEATRYCPLYRNIYGIIRHGCMYTTIERAKENAPVGCIGIATVEITCAYTI
jgi:hypothetical protein